jgi:Ca2+:H+ antiporter
LFSHKALYQDDNEDVMLSKGYDGPNPWLQLRPRRRRPQAVSSPDGEIVAGSHDVESTDPEHESPDSGTEVEPYMSVAVCLGLLVAVTVVRVTGLR